ncbi:ThiF family adenylyltransferase [Candidatus Wolfebacteria bacterium]|nr:ThiF family adenylyltransferase [Candidatus Wolfebacteria bacterium]
MNNSKPIKFNKAEEKFEDFKKRLAPAEILDVYKELLEDLFLIRNPKYKFNKNYQEDFEIFWREHLGSKLAEEVGEWFYFPWNKKLVHYLEDELHQELRTARNKNLITPEEQEKFYNFKVGIAGLSVGSHIALTLAMMGGAKVIKIADPDVISGSNLNRIRFGFTKAGINKCDLIAQQIYEVNPYSEVHAYLQGITTENLNEFLVGPPKLDAVCEVTDFPELKIRMRLEARKLGIPVLMPTDNGDNVIFDVERFDLDPNLQLFNGAAGDLTLEEFQKFPPQELPKLATKIAGPEFVVPRMLSSVMEVGKTLYSWPQLGDAATLAGVSTAYVIKRLALGQKLKSGRLEVNLDSIFDPDYSTPEAAKQRNEERKTYLRGIGFDV